LDRLKAEVAAQKDEIRRLEERNKALEGGRERTVADAAFRRAMEEEGRARGEEGLAEIRLGPLVKQTRDCLQLLHRLWTEATVQVRAREELLLAQQAEGRMPPHLSQQHHYHHEVGPARHAPMQVQPPPQQHASHAAMMLPPPPHPPPPQPPQQQQQLPQHHHHLRGGSCELNDGEGGGRKPTVSRAPHCCSCA
jgi:hypothetical protein